MRIVRSVEVMQDMALISRRAGLPIGLVPTMGYLHDGHLSLIKQARQAVGRKGRVVVSIYVNPTQFGPGEDLSRYPRDLPRDTQLCRKAGADVLFVPSDAQMYPQAEREEFSTFVTENVLSQRMEGQARPTHFRGVTTIVAKLFNIVQPDLAVFGQKDFQQASVIQRMVRDLNFPVRIVVAPTVREKDGLAMSSRNKYLTAEERVQAVVLWKALQWAKRRVLEAGSAPTRSLEKKLRALICEQPAARVDYISFFDPNTLEAVARAQRGIQMALAVFIGRTRLIDNLRL